jgi:hypothetical protein
METLMSTAMVIEGGLLSVLLALWMTWLALRGLFRLIPAATPIIEPIRFVANRQTANRRREAA